MGIDYELLQSVGTSNDRLREVFTAEPFSELEEVPEEKKLERQKDLEVRKYFEDLIGRRLQEHIGFSLQNHAKYSAIDLAWDSVPINKATYPLLLYAQGKLDLGACADSLNTLGCANQYVTRDDKGLAKGIDLPKFYEVNINLVRSMVTRRLAAQANKYSNLFPFYKYESRATSTVGKLRSDLMSQRMDIMADQFDYRHHETQVIRDMFLYGHSMDFMRSGWEREVNWVRDNPADEFREGVPLRKKAVITKEGVCWDNPHPSRTFWDNNYPISSINTDSGCEYCGFWDVKRYRDVKFNTDYWNRDKVSYSSHIINLFSTYAQYFSQYYNNIKVPSQSSTSSDLSGGNDRKNNIGLYVGTHDDSAMVLAVTYMKVNPQKHRLGEYPYPVWIRFITGGDNTILFAEIMPTTPAAYAGHNENDSRQVNISVAHEVLPYQDQLTNLFSYLLLAIKSDTIKCLLIDQDVATPEMIASFRAQAKGKNYYAEPMVLEVSGNKMRDLGIDVTKVVQLIETRQSAAINVIFQAIMQLLNMVERLMALSPQEQGQPAPREISATETNLIAGTTESVYSFISSSIDEYRNAKKRILYEAYMACGDQAVRLPVLNRYSGDVIKAAGFEVNEAEIDEFQDPNETVFHTIIGTKNKLIHDYIFTSRDGSERSVNTQSANVLTQLLAILQQPVIAQAVGKQRMYEIVNEIFRLSGAGVDLKLEMKEGESDSIGVDLNQQVQQVLSQLTAQVEQNTQAIQQIETEIHDPPGTTAAS